MNSVCAIRDFLDAMVAAAAFAFPLMFCKFQQAWADHAETLDGSSFTCSTFHQTMFCLQVGKQTVFSWILFGQTSISCSHSSSSLYVQLSGFHQIGLFLNYVLLTCQLHLRSSVLCPILLVIPNAHPFRPRKAVFTHCLTPMSLPSPFFTTSFPFPPQSHLSLGSMNALHASACTEHNGCKSL